MIRGAPQLDRGCLNPCFPRSAPLPVAYVDVRTGPFTGRGEEGDWSRRISPTSISMGACSAVTDSSGSARGIIGLVLVDVGPSYASVERIDDCEIAAKHLRCEASGMVRSSHRLRVRVASGYRYRVSGEWTTVCFNWSQRRPRAGYFVEEPPSFVQCIPMVLATGSVQGTGLLGRGVRLLLQNRAP